MAKLDFKKLNSTFELEVGDEIYVGILNDLTKAQKAKQDKQLKPYKQSNETTAKMLSKISRLEAKLSTKKHLEDWDAVDKIEDEIYTLQDDIRANKDALDEILDLEVLFKDRLKMSVKSDDIVAILKAGEDHGYQNVFNTILEDIQERNKKK